MLAIKKGKLIVWGRLWAISPALSLGWQEVVGVMVHVQGLSLDKNMDSSSMVAVGGQNIWK